MIYCISVHSNSWFTGADGDTDDYKIITEIESDKKNKSENINGSEDQKFSFAISSAHTADPSPSHSVAINITSSKYKLQVLRITRCLPSQPSSIKSF